MEWFTEDAATHDARIAEYRRQGFGERDARHRAEVAGLLALLRAATAEPAATLTHDPDDPMGCAMCPLFFGVPRDGVCQGMHGRTVDFHRGRFVAPPECPLRRGDVVVRRPR